MAYHNKKRTESISIVLQAIDNHMRQGIIFTAHRLRSRFVSSTSYAV